MADCDHNSAINLPAFQNAHLVRPVPEREELNQADLYGVSLDPADCNTCGAASCCGPTTSQWVIEGREEGYDFSPLLDRIRVIRYGTRTENTYDSEGNVTGTRDCRICDVQNSPAYWEVFPASDAATGNGDLFYGPTVPGMCVSGDTQYGSVFSCCFPLRYYDVKFGSSLSEAGVWRRLHLWATTDCRYGLGVDVPPDPDPTQFNFKVRLHLIIPEDYCLDPCTLYECNEAVDSEYAYGWNHGLSYNYTDWNDQYFYGDAGGLRDSWLGSNSFQWCETDWIYMTEGLSWDDLQNVPTHPTLLDAKWDRCDPEDGPYPENHPCRAKWYVSNDPTPPVSVLTMRCEQLNCHSCKDGSTRIYANTGYLYGGGVEGPNPEEIINLGYRVRNTIDETDNTCNGRFEAYWPECVTPKRILWSFGEEGPSAGILVPWIQSKPCPPGVCTAKDTASSECYDIEHDCQYYSREGCTEAGGNIPGTGEYHLDHGMVMVDDRGCLYMACNEQSQCGCCPGSGGSLSVANIGTFEHNGETCCQWLLTASAGSPGIDCPSSCVPGVEVQVGGNVAASDGCPEGYTLDDENYCLCHGPNGSPDRIAGGGGLVMGNGSTFGISLCPNCKECIRWRSLPCICQCASPDGWNYIFLKGCETFSPEGSPSTACGGLCDGVSLGVSLGLEGSSSETANGITVWCFPFDVIIQGLCLREFSGNVRIDWGDGTIEYHALEAEFRVTHCYVFPEYSDPEGWCVRMKLMTAATGADFPSEQCGDEFLYGIGQPPNCF